MWKGSPCSYKPQECYHSKQLYSTWPAPNSRQTKSATGRGRWWSTRTEKVTIGCSGFCSSQRDCKLPFGFSQTQYPKHRWCCVHINDSALIRSSIYISWHINWTWIMYGVEYTWKHGQYHLAFLTRIYMQKLFNVISTTNMSVRPNPN